MTTEERLHASADVLARTLITAPVAGKIVNLLYKAERGVVQPGAPIMDIVPAEDTLLIDARVSPNDIDIVHAGLKAQVQFTAYSSRRTPRISGVVRTVSADRIIDAATHQAYFLARVEVYRSSLAEAGTGVEMVPGMPADVLIVTGERTLAQYFMQPFFDALWRACRGLTPMMRPSGIPTGHASKKPERMRLRLSTMCSESVATRPDHMQLHDNFGTYWAYLDRSCVRLRVLHQRWPTLCRDRSPQC